MHKRDKLSIAITTALFTQLGAANIAYAEQETVDNSIAGIERIEVRTRKVTETIETIPLAISAISNKEIDEKGIQSSDDVAKYINGVAFDIGAAPNSTLPSIRGLTTDRGRPNVAILVDGIDVSSETMTLPGGGMTANMKLLDLQQVEVVKGPQSVNYGRSAFSGAINYVTKRPSFHNTTKLDVNVAQDGIYDLAASFEGAITEEFAARIKLIDSASDGHYTNPNTGGNLGGSDTKGVALSALYLPNDSLTFYFRGEYSDQHLDPRPVVSISTMNPESYMNPNNPFDPMNNLFLTGSLNKEYGATMLPYEFDSNGNGVDCAMAEALPYWNTHPGAMFTPGLPPQPNCRPIIKGEVSADSAMLDLSPDPRTGKDFSGTDIENTRAALEIEWEGEYVSFVSNTSFTKSESYVQEDFDVTNFGVTSIPAMPPWAPAISQQGFHLDVDTSYDVEQINQEFRFTGYGDGFNWVLSGLYWQEEMTTLFGAQTWLRDGANAQTLVDSVYSFVPCGPGCAISNLKTAPFSYADNRYTPITRKTEHWSVAGLFNYELTDQLNLTFEGRYLDETIDYTGNADDRAFDAIYYSFTFPGMPPFEMHQHDANEFALGDNYLTKNSVSDSSFLPRFSLDYKVNETVFTYMSASKGFKPGGITTTDANGDVSSGEYRPETLWAYEIGAKAFSSENNVLVNTSIFYWDYTDQQVPFTFVNEFGMANVSVINAGETEVKGFELESIWQITPKLRLSFAYLYSDASYTDFNVAKAIEQSDINANISDVDRAIAGNAEADFSGSRLPLSPLHSGTVNARYTTELYGMNTFVELFGQYKSERNVDRGEHAQLPAYSEWDLSAGFQGDNWSVTAYVNNLFDDDTIKHAVGNVDYGFMPDYQSVPYAVHATLPTPRIAGVRLSYTFN
ncbi:TonB-dependent receptor [Colwellia sp. MEBiC06753]